MRKRTHWIIGIAALVCLLVLARAALPFVVKDYVNDRLARMESYSGHVTDVDLSLLTGAYRINGLEIVKLGGTAPQPFAQAPAMTISLQWSALLDGRLVGEIDVASPVVNMVQAEDEEDSQLGLGVNWPDQIRKLFPFRFNRVEVTDGLVRFRAPGIDSDDSLTLHGVRMRLLNLTNVENSSEPTPADLELTGLVMGDAPLTLAGTIDPNADPPELDLNFELENADITEANPWFEQFLNIDTERGTFSMYAEIAAAQGRFEGYVRPILENPEVYRRGEEASGPFRRAWEVIVDLAANVLENREEDQVATQIPLSGELEDPDSDIIATIVNLLRNAFLTAFSHSIEGSISLRNLGIGDGSQDGDRGDNEDDDDDGDGDANGRDRIASADEDDGDN